MKKSELKPEIIVTYDRWSREPYVVFENDKIIGGAIPDDWINDEYLNQDETDLTRDEIAENMESEFFAENDTVDEFWPEYKICRAGDDYYRYGTDGMAKWIGNYDSIQEAIEG